MQAWLAAFVVTQLCELPVYYAATRRWSVGFFASAITHPLVWFAFPLLPLPYWPMVACAELFAVLAEAAWLRANGLRWARALGWSLAANATSLSIGLTLRATTGLV